MLRLTLLGERVIVFAYLLIFTGVCWPWGTYFLQKAGPAGASNPYDFAAFALLIPFLAIGVFAQRRDLGFLARAAWPALALSVLAFLSAFWADDPVLVLRRSTTLGATTLFGVYLAGRGDFDTLVRDLLKVCAVAAVLSLVMVVVFPQLGTSTTTEMYRHSWRGTFTDKNELGLFCGTGIIVAGYALVARLGPRWLSGFTILACLVLLYGSQSKTPLVMVMAAIYAGLVGSVLRRRNGAGLAAGFLLIVIGLAGAAVIALDSEIVFAALGRDATLTNRAKIWHYALMFISRRPWLGYGFGGFWRADGLEANDYWTLVQFQTPHAHNGFLEVALALGLVGIGLTALAWAVLLLRSLRVLTRPAARHTPFCLALLAGIFVENLTEYEFLRQTHILWVLFATVATYLGQQLLAARRPVPAPGAVPLAAPA